MPLGLRQPLLSKGITLLGAMLLSGPLLVGCVVKPAARPAPARLSASEHRDRARYHRQMADELRRRYVPAAVDVFQPDVLRYESGLAAGSALDPLPLERHNPTEIFLLDAWRHEQRAAAHESAARLVSQR
jgi:hypothetical protein